MKKLLALLLTAALLVMSFPMMSVVAAGTDAEGYTLIETAADFVNIKNNPSGAYKLVSNIILPDDYVPFEFSGILLGDDENSLKSITVNIGAEDSVNYWGLFSVVSGAFQIKNILLKGSVTGANGDGRASWGYTGGFAGMTSNLSEGAIIENCVNEATITNVGTTPEGTGGFIGKDLNKTQTLTLKNLTNKGPVTSTALNNGGIAGTFSGNALYCSNIAAINGNTGRGVGGSGGLFGNLEGAVVNQCFNTGSVFDSNASGGIAGIINYEGGSGSNSATITNCYNTGSVSARNLATCGILGAANKSGNTVLIENCYTAVVPQTRPVAYIPGSSLDAPVVNTYYLRASASADVDGSSHLTEEQFKDLSNFTGFSSDVWEIEALSGYSYPQLKNNRQAYIQYTEIATADDFEIIRTNPTAAYKLVADINLGNFTPIDNFSGHLIGDNETELRTITIASESPKKGQEYYGGLFKKISGSASIQNIKLEGSLSVFCDGNYNAHIGGFAGAVIDGKKGINITNCINDVDITLTTTSSMYIYGFGGFIGTNGWYLDSGANGEACSELVLDKLVNYGNLTAEGGIGRFYAIGGIAGSAAGTIKKCANFADISHSSSKYVGGILGTTNGVVIEDSFNIGNLANVNSAQSAGIVCSVGIPGSTATITRCFNRGTVRFGIAGFDATVEECYSVFVGGGLDNHLTSNNAHISKSYFYYSSPATINGADYLTLAEFTKEESFPEFDFDNTWIMDVRSSYPYPQLRVNRTAYEVINEIANQDDFKAMNDSSESFVLKNDIILTDDYEIASFSGNFDGNGKTITVNGGKTPLFTVTTASAEIYNLTVKGDISVSGTGAVLVKTNSGTISDCENYAGFTAGSYSGVFAANNVGKIDGCVNYADIEFIASGCGGIAGENNGIITDCGNHGNIKQNSGAAGTGGIAGQHGAGNVITNCYNTGTIEGGTDVGGIIGTLFRDNSSVADCYNAGNVIASGGKFAGGIIGGIGHAGRGESNPYTGIAITNCYNSGAIMRATTNNTAEWAIYGEIINKSANPSISGCAYLAAETTEEGNIQGLVRAEFDAKVKDYNITLCDWSEISAPVNYNAYENNLYVFSADKYLTTEEQFKVLGKNTLLSFAYANFGRMGWALDNAGFIISKTNSNPTVDGDDCKVIEIGRTNTLGDFSILAYGDYITEGSYYIKPYAKYTRVGENTETVYGNTASVNTYVAKP